jgi:hypothetical protein
MLDAIVNTFKKFREDIYSFFPSRQDASMDLVDSLSGNTTATSVVELSLSPTHRRNYSSITRVLDEHPPRDNVVKRNELTALLSGCCPELKNRRYHVFGVDSTPNPRIFSPTVADRSYVYAPNAISENKPITVGHKYSIVSYFPEKNEQSPPWVVPLSCERVSTNQKSAWLGMKQISACIQSQKSFQERICVSVSDSEYSHPRCFAEARRNPNQIHISRARNNRVFYYPSTQIKSINQLGRPTSYGDKHVLRDEATWRTPDEAIEFDIVSKKGKHQNIKIDCWNKIMMRGKNESTMFD